MDIKSLKQFEAVVRTGSVSSAARELGLTQPAVSMGLSRLQEETGLKLLQKAGVGVVPTEAGGQLLLPVRRVLDDFEALEKAVEGLKHEPGKLTIAFCDRGPEWFLVPRFRLTVAEKENFEVNSQFARGMDAVNMLKDGTADIVVTEHPIKEKGIACDFLVRDIHYLSVPSRHPLASKREIRLMDAGPLQILFYCLDGAFSVKFLEFLKTRTPNVDLQIERDYFVFQERLRRTDALTFTTALVRHYRFDGPQRDDIAMTDPGSDIGYWISYKRSAQHHNPKIEKFCKFAKGLVAASGLSTDPNLF